MDKHLKPFKGEIKVKRVKRYSKTETNRYGPNLGFIYIVDFVDHPQFRGFNAFNGNTSLVVSEVTLEDGSIEVETLNSLYKRWPEDNN